MSFWLFTLSSLLSLGLTSYEEDWEGFELWKSKLLGISFPIFGADGEERGIIRQLIVLLNYGRKIEALKLKSDLFFKFAWKLGY